MVLDEVGCGNRDTLLVAGDGDVGGGGGGAAGGVARGDEVRKWAAVVAGMGLAAACGLALRGGDVPPAWWARTGAGLSGDFFNANYITVLACVVGFLTVLASWGMPFKGEPGVSDGRYRGEFFAMLMFSLAGVSMVGKVNDLIWLFVVLELVSIPTYIMVATGRAQTAAQEAGVKYFFLGALAAAIYLFGFSYLYGYAGSTRLAVIGAQFAKDMAANGGHVPAMATIGLLMVLLGVSYKIAAVPLHFYTPDVYQGAATPVTAFLAFAPKAAGMVAIILMLALMGYQVGMEKGLGATVGLLLMVMAVLTMTVGNVLALLQRSSVKRMLAYSSIAHSGYMLVGLACGPGVGMEDGVSATLFYLGAYAVMNLGAFAVLIYLEGKAEGAESLDDLAGVAKEHPVAALAMAVCMFSLIGVPPTIGFLGKLYLVLAALAHGHKVLAIILVINAAIAAAYYLRVVATMYLREAWNPVVVRETIGPRITWAVCAVGVVVLFFVPAPMLVALSFR